VPKTRKSFCESVVAMDETEKAIIQLNKIVEKFPQTDAAEKAVSIINELEHKQ